MTGAVTTGASNAATGSAGTTGQTVTIDTATGPSLGDTNFDHLVEFFIPFK